MDLEFLPMGTRCLVDANIIIYQLDELSPQCKHFFTRVALREIAAYITTTIIAEVLHRQMMNEAMIKNLVTGRQTLRKLKANPSLITSLNDYIVEVEKLLRLPFETIEVTRADITASHALRSTHGLFVNDSINLACAMRAGIVDIVTHDDDFRRVAGFNVWQPTDI